jgi:hypothetical protein
MFGKDYAGSMIRERHYKRAVALITLMYILGFCAVLSFWGGVIWAAVHFIRKYW